MKLWVDDMKDPSIYEGLDGLLWPMGEWTWVKTAQDARPLLESGDVTVLALDNDLGLESDSDGRVLAHWLLDRVLDGEIRPPAMMRCISFNPIAGDEIRRTFLDIERAAEQVMADAVAAAKALIEETP